MPAPRAGERPAVYADRIGEWYAARKSARHRKEHGLFLTPVPVAEFMAGRVKAVGRERESMSGKNGSLPHPPRTVVTAPLAPTEAGE